MKSIGILLLALSVARAPVFAEETASPHDMLLADGETDTDKCSLCHEDDLSLSRSKLETCTLCHALTAHAGAREHLAADAARVARIVPAPEAGVAVLPLADDGRMYCGTCHVFHDPRVSDEKVLDRAWIPDGALARAVRESLTGDAAAPVAAHGDAGSGLKFADGTKRLRLSIADGALCRHCHRFEK